MRKRTCLSLLLLCLPILGVPQTRTSPKTALPTLGEGKKDSPMVVETFTDYQCPPCRQLYLGTLRRLIEDYCNTGKVYLLHHDFPWPQHAYARQTARWGLAAAVIGKYETVSEALYTKQESIAANGNIEAAVAEVLSPAELKKLKEVMIARGAEIDAAIDKDKAFGEQQGVSSTPSIKITYKGSVVAPLNPGVIPYAILKRFLDEQLAK
jgi:protein-disulfide isomerase